MFWISRILLGLVAVVGMAAVAQRVTNSATPTSADTSAKATKPAMVNVDVTQFDKLRSLKKHVILDVRTPEEFAAGHLVGATNIDVGAADFGKRIEALDTNKVYLVYCRSGRRSVTACNLMAERRFGRLYNLLGGIKAWTEAGMKTER